MKEIKFYIPECKEAYLTLNKYDSGIYKIEYIEVPENQRRKGCGTKLFCQCFKYLKNNNIDKVTGYFLSNDAIRICFETAKKMGIEILPRFCVVKDKNYEPVRYKTEKEIKKEIYNFMKEFGYKSIYDIPKKILLKNFGDVNLK